VAAPLDHLVYTVTDLAAAVAEVEKALGVRPVAGGRHESLGTHNALLPVGGGAYLELIAADPDAPAPAGPRPFAAAPRPFGLDDLERPRLATWAVRSRDLDGALREARERGYDPGRALEVSRAQPDGGRLRWRLSLRDEPFGDGLVPFLIDWGDAPHPSSRGPAGCSLRQLRGEHPDPEPIREALAALGASLTLRSAPRPRLLADLEGPGGRLRLG
jgi:hypothetical protein